MSVDTAKAGLHADSSALARRRQMSWCRRRGAAFTMMAPSTISILRQMSSGSASYSAALRPSGKSIQPGKAVAGSVGTAVTGLSLLRCVVRLTVTGGCGQVLRGRDADNLHVDAIRAENPGDMGQGGLGEWEQRIGREMLALRQQDGVHDHRRLKVRSQVPAAGQLGGSPDETLQDGRRPGDQALRRDEALGEQVAKRCGPFGALDVDELIARAEQVADLQRAACPQPRATAASAGGW